MKKLFYISLILFSSCSPRILSPLSDSEKLKYQPNEINEMDSISGYLTGIVKSGMNKKRERYVYNSLKDIGGNVRKERIDIYSFQHNCILEIKGESEKIIYLTAHLDKTDMNVFKQLSLYLNGFLDEAIFWSYRTQGAIDNGTGVATVLMLANKLSQQGNYYTYKILLTGSEESGIRGARSHVARIPLNEWGKIQCCINIDCIGIKDERFAIVKVKNDPYLTKLSIDAAKEMGIDMVFLNLTMGVSDNTPFGKTSAATDFGRSLLFNFPGAFLPQRSYFTSKKSAPTIFFSCTGIGESNAVNLLNPWLPFAIPNGSIHSYSDNLSKIDKVKLFEGYTLIKELLHKIEDQKIY